VDYYAPCREKKTKIDCSGQFYPLHAAVSKLGRIRTQLQLIYFLVRKKYSVYHLHDPELIPLGLLLKIAKKRVIFDVHENVLADIGAKNYLRPWLRKIIFILFRGFFYLAQRNFDWFVLAERSYPKIMNTNKYEIIYNYPLFRNIDVPAEKKWEYGMVYVGSITVDRGIWDMLSVFRSVHYIMPQSSLHLIGPVDETGLEQEIAEWLRNNSLCDSVYLHGRIPNEQTFDIIRHNSVGLCLLRKNVFSAIEPTKIFEYMMTSLPVVATNCQLWKAIVENNKCGIAIDPDNILESAESIVSLLKDAQRLKEFGKNGLNAIRSKFNWDTEEGKLLGIYDDLMCHLVDK